MLSQQLEEANQAKDRFLSIVSHELKTPTTNIRVQSQFLQRRLAKQRQSEVQQATIMPTLQQIEKQTGHLTQLIDELLDVRRIQTGKITLQMQRCGIRECEKNSIEALW